MLSDLVGLLACPHCDGELVLDRAALRCSLGHSFDVARQGYVTLLRDGSPGGDTAAMVAARAAFLGAGHYAPITAGLVRALAGVRGPIVDAGAGTGQHLAGVLDADPGRVGLALDLSRPAARWAARSHPRAGAVVCDTWRRWPVRAGAAAAVLDVFAPRHGAETARVLAPGGILVVVTPTPRHLAELVDRLGLLAVDPDKPGRVAAQLAGLFTPVDSTPVEFGMTLDHDAVAALVGMGPSAWHTGADELHARIAVLPMSVPVTASVTVATYRAR